MTSAATKRRALWLVAVMAWLVSSNAMGWTLARNVGYFLMALTTAVALGEWVNKPREDLDRLTSFGEKLLDEMRRRDAAPDDDEERKASNG